jgi:hypothetical protein
MSCVWLIRLPTSSYCVQRPMPRVRSVAVLDGAVVRDSSRGLSRSIPMSTTTVPAEGDTQEQIVTPWDVQGSVSEDGKQAAIDYDKLVRQFGTRLLDESILARFEKLTGHKPHVFLRRGLFFSHRYVHRERRALGSFFLTI